MQEMYKNYSVKSEKLDIQNRVPALCLSLRTQSLIFSVSCGSELIPPQLGDKVLHEVKKKKKNLIFSDEAFGQLNGSDHPLKVKAHTKPAQKSTTLT